jgi:hypothetical protein
MEDKRRTCLVGQVSVVFFSLSRQILDQTYSLLFYKLPFPYSLQLLNINSNFLFQFTSTKGVTGTF